MGRSRLEQGYAIAYRTARRVTPVSGQGYRSSSVSVAVASEGARRSQGGPTPRPPASRASLPARATPRAEASRAPSPHPTRRAVPLPLRDERDIGALQRPDHRAQERGTLLCQRLAERDGEVRPHQRQREPRRACARPDIDHPGGRKWAPARTHRRASGRPARLRFGRRSGRCARSTPHKSLEPAGDLRSVSGAATRAFLGAVERGADVGEAEGLRAGHCGGDGTRIRSRVLISPVSLPAARECRSRTARRDRRGSRRGRRFTSR